MSSIPINVTSTTVNNMRQTGSAGFLKNSSITAKSLIPRHSEVRLYNLEILKENKSSP